MYEVWSRDPYPAWKFAVQDEQGYPLGEVDAIPSTFPTPEDITSTTWSSSPSMPIALSPQSNTTAAEGSWVEISPSSIIVVEENLEYDIYVIELPAREQKRFICFATESF